MALKGSEDFAFRSSPFARVGEKGMLYQFLNYDLIEWLDHSPSFQSFTSQFIHLNFNSCDASVYEWVDGFHDGEQDGEDYGGGDDD